MCSDGLLLERRYIEVSDLDLREATVAFLGRCYLPAVRRGCVILEKIVGILGQVVELGSRLE